MGPRDFRRTPDETSNISLAKFFEHWFEKGFGHPILDFSLAIDAERDGPTTIPVCQLQNNSQKMSSLFDFGPEIAVVVENDQWQQQQ